MLLLQSDGHLTDAHIQGVFAVGIDDGLPVAVYLAAVDESLAIASPVKLHQALANTSVDQVLSDEVHAHSIKKTGARRRPS